MNIQSKLPTTADEFLRWNEGREDRKYEFVDGQVREYSRAETRAHTGIATQCVVYFSSQLDEEEFSIGCSGFLISTPHGLRRPDVLIDRRTEDSSGQDLFARSPILVGEILSPESQERDLGEKAVDYQLSPTLMHYLVLSQDEFHARVWSRNSAGQWAMRETRGDHEAIEFEAFGVSARLADLYGHRMRRHSA